MDLGISHFRVAVPGVLTTLIMAWNKIVSKMNSFYKSIMLIAAAAMTFVSCQKEIENQEIDNGPKMKTIKVSTGIATRTTLDSNHENLIWSSGDKISIFNDIDNTNSEIAYSAGGYIEVAVPESTTEIYAHYPYFNGNTSGPKSVSVYISNSQTQTNPGELNGHCFPMVAKGTVSSDNKALISLYPVASALALNIYHTELDGEESVTSVKVTPSSGNTKFTGSQVTDLTNDDIQYAEAASSDPITLTLTNPLALGSTKPENKQTFAGQLYVCLAKQSYASVTFEIETTKGTYTITSSSTTPFDCVSNDFVPVNINLAKADFDGPEHIDPVNPTDFSWTLVKDAIAVGDKVVIAAAGSDVAMSTTQNNNNRGQVAVAKEGNSLTANADVQVFEVVAGSKDNTFALKCLNGDQISKYIAAASSGNNYMHSNADIDANASWSVSIGTDGVAEVVAQGSYTRNTIQYNHSNSLFACYASASQAGISFYRAGLPSANLSFPEASYTVNLGETFTAPALTNPNSVSVTYSSSDTDVATVNASTGEVTIGSTAGTATITASFAGNSTYSASEASYAIEVIDPNVERWVKTAIGSITASDVFVIVGDDGYALPHNNGSSSAPGLVAVTISNNKITSTVSNEIKWNISGNATDGYVFYPNGNTSSWLYCTNTNNGVRVGDNANKLFTIDNNGYLVNNATNRYLSVYSTQDWRCYSSTSNNPQVIEFYVKQGGSSTPTKTLSSISVTAPTKTTYTVGDTFDATGMVVTATYSDASTADVTTSATTDFATQVASAGNKTVTVSYTEDGINKTDTFDITVNAASGGNPTTSTLTFTAACGGSGTADDGAEWTVTSDGTESNFDNDCGIHYGTNKASVTYLQLSTSDIEGTVSKVVVNARDAQACATISVTVGGTAFSCSGSNIATNTSADYTFTGSGSGAIVVRVDRGSSITKAIYVKSVAVTYE